MKTAFVIDKAKGRYTLYETTLGQAWDTTINNRERFETDQELVTALIKYLEGKNIDIDSDVENNDDEFIVVATASLSKKHEYDHTYFLPITEKSFHELLNALNTLESDKWRLTGAKDTMPNWFPNESVQEKETK